MGPLLKWGWYLVTKDMEKTEVLSGYLQWRRISLGNIEQNWTHMRFDGLHTSAGELADIVMRSLLIVFERSSRTKEVP